MSTSGANVKECTSLTRKENSLINSLMPSSAIVSERERLKLSLKDLVIASTTSIDHIAEAIRSCDTFQRHPQLKTVPFLMYFIGEIPKAVHEALTLQKHKLVLAADSSVRFPTTLDFNKLISGAANRNPLDVTLLSSAKHTAYPVIHPQMYQCFPSINPLEMQKFEQFQGGLILWIRSKNGQKVLKKLLECTLKENCLAPTGAKQHCDYAKIYSENLTFSGCHRFDQSAINLILYEESRFQPNLFQWNYPDFIIEKKAKL